MLSCVCLRGCIIPLTHCSTAHAPNMASWLTGLMPSWFSPALHTENQGRTPFQSLYTDYSYERECSSLLLSNLYRGFPLTTLSIAWEITSFISEGGPPWCIITSSTMPNKRSLSEKLSPGLITQDKRERSEFIHPGDKTAKSHKLNVQQKEPDTNE